MRRRVISVLAAGSVALLLAGCSTTGTGSTSSSGSTTVTVFNNTDNKAAFDQEIAAYKKVKPNVDIKVTYTGVADGQATLATQLAAGTAPDIINGYPGSGASNSTQQMAAKNYLADLSSTPWAKEVAEGDKQALSYKDKLYAAPQTALGIGYIYSKQVMDKSGLTPPTTWSEVQPFCKAAAAKGTPAYALGLQTGWPGILIPYALTATLVYKDAPTFTDDQKAGSASFTDSKWVQAYQMYKQMSGWGCFQKSPNGTTYEQTMDQAATGKALGVVQLPSALGLVEKTAPAGTTWELSALPATDDAEDTVLPSAVITVYMLNAKAAKKQAAVDFLNFLASGPAISIQAKVGSAIPAIPVSGYKATSPAVQSVIDYRTKGDTYPFIDNLWPNPKVQQVMISGIQSLINGKTDPAGVTKQMDAAFTG